MNPGTAPRTPGHIVSATKEGIGHAHECTCDRNFFHADGGCGPRAADEHRPELGDIGEPVFEHDDTGAFRVDPELDHDEHHFKHDDHDAGYGGPGSVELGLDPVFDFVHAGFDLRHI